MSGEPAGWWAWLGRAPIGSGRSEQEEKLRARLRTLAGKRRRSGYRRLRVLLRREGWAVNHKRVYRLCREEGLGVRRRRRKRIGAVERQPLLIPTRPGGVASTVRP